MFFQYSLSPVLLPESSSFFFLPRLFPCRQGEALPKTGADEHPQPAHSGSRLTSSAAPRRPRAGRRGATQVAASGTSAGGRPAQPRPAAAEAAPSLWHGLVPNLTVPPATNLDAENDKAAPPR